MSDYRDRRFKKRRHQDDDDRDNRSQRARYDDPLLRLKKETLTIAESPLIRIEESVKSIAKSYVSHFDNESTRDGFNKFLKQLVIEQPLKIPFAAAIALYANHRKPEAGKSITDVFATAAQQYLQQCQWREFKLCLRFLCCASAMLGGNGLETIMDDLINFAGDLAEDRQNLELSRLVSYIALMAIPYMLSSAPRSGNMALANMILERISGIQKPPLDLQDQLSAFFGENAPLNSESVFSLFLKQLQDEKSSGWGFGALPRPWETFVTEFETAETHELPAISMPTQLEGKTVFPDLNFSVFRGQIVETVPPENDITFTLFRDIVIDTVNIMDFNRVACAKCLIDIDCFFAPDTFLKRATPFDKIKDIIKEKPLWKPEDVVVDAIFALIYRLPHPEHKLVYYHSLLTEICKIAPQAVAPSLGRAIRFLYKNIGSFDVELRYRFLDWFSHHLSNFGFTWKWIEWQDDLSLPDAHPKKSFVTEAIEKEIRLSFANRVKGTLPDAYDFLIGPEKERDFPEFQYESEDSPFVEPAKELLSLIRQKAPDEDIEPVLKKIMDIAKEQNLPSPDRYAREIFVTSVCHVGAKSLSHVLSCIERCKEKLAALGAEIPSAQREMVGAVMKYWKSQPGVGANVIDKLLNYSILTPSSIVEWVLLDAGGEVLPRGHAWEMVNNTSRKVIERTNNLSAAKMASDIPEDQLALLDAGYEAAKAEQAFLFSNALGSLDRSANDGNNDALEGDKNTLLRWWATAWGRAIKRKLDVDRAEDIDQIDGEDVVLTDAAAVTEE